MDFSGQILGIDFIITKLCYESFFFVVVLLDYFPLFLFGNKPVQFMTLFMAFSCT